MTDSSYSRQIFLLNQVTSLASRLPDRQIIHQGVQTGTSLGSVNHFNTIVYATTRFDELHNNVKAAYSMLSHSESGLKAIASELESLHTQADIATSTLLKDGGSERNSLRREARQILANINTIAENLSFEGSSLLDGNLKEKTFLIDDKKIGSNTEINNFTVHLSSVTSSDLGLQNINLNSKSEAEKSVIIIDTALATVNQYLSQTMTDKNKIESAFSDIQKETLRQQETRTLSYDLDFVTNNSFFKNIQIRNRPELPYLSTGASISKATVSFKI